MKTLVVYDSMFGNTAMVAGAIADSLVEQAEVRLLPVAEATPGALSEAELLFVGSPTQRFRPLPAITALLAKLPAGSLERTAVAAFDTRIVVADAHNALLGFFVRLQGPSAYAAARIERALKRAGGRPVAPGAGFFVDGTEGPLKAGELERAAKWAQAGLVKAREPVRVAAASGKRSRRPENGAPRHPAAG